jgi:ubiquinone/menaquinone biosynthesis C-methylase UbiE
VVGIDIDADEVKRAANHAAQRAITNVEFREGSVYAIPFADTTFDAVYSNALLDHLSNPVAALREIYRVLKPGGVAGVRTADRDGYLFSPADPLIEQWAQEGEAEKAAQGIRVRIGKHLRNLLRQAGFTRTEMSASFDCYGTTEQVQNLSRAMAASIRREKDGSGRDSTIDAYADAWQRWGESPDAFFGHCLCEGLGWRA